MALLDEEAGEYFVELLKTKFEEAGLKDFQNILQHLRDDDPKEVDKVTGKKKLGKNQLWSSGTLNLFQMGLTDVHVHALCEALKEFPCVSKIDLRRNFLSYRSADYIVDAVKHQLKRVTELEYYEKMKPDKPQTVLHAQCARCHEEVIFRKRDSEVATCLICGYKAYRVIYILREVQLKETYMSPEDELKWRTVDCDVDLTDKLIQTLQSHEPMSVPKFKRICRSTCKRHLKDWASELDEKFEIMHQRKSDKSKLKIALRAEHEKRKKKLFTSVRNFIDDKSRKHYLKLYRKQASYELQSLMKSTITSTAKKMSKAFLPIFPTTTANILQIMQNFHHDAKEVIRKTKWHVPKLMKLLYDLIFRV